MAASVACTFGVSDRKGRTNPERFPYRRNEQGKHLCRVCSSVLEGRKTSFCGVRCIRDFFMQTDWQRVRQVIYVRDGGVCMNCGKEVPKNDFHVDHIKAIVNGGAEWDLNNLELSCPTCNLRKGRK